MATVMACSGLAGGLASPVHAAPRGSSASEFDGLMERAEERRMAGMHREAAGVYIEAYRALPDSEQMGLMGEVVIDSALEDFRQAHHKEPEVVALLEEPIALLEEYIAARTRAHQAGKADAVPGRLRDELAQLKAQLEQAQGNEEVAPSSDVDDGDEPEPPPAESRSGPRPADVALVVGGVVALGGGAGLIGAGARNVVMLEERYQERLEALAAGDFTPEQQQEVQDELAAWRRQWRARSTGLVLGGSLLAVAGLGLTTWGILRLRRGKSGSTRSAKVTMPMIAPTGRGVVVSMGF